MKYKCKICGKDYSTKLGLSVHMTSCIKKNTKYSTQEEYYIYVLNKKKGKCKKCGKHTKFNNIPEGYYDFCSTKCVALCKEIRNKIKQTNIIKYGVDHPLKLVEIQEKQQNTNIERYGVTHPMKSERIQEKQKQTIIETYGVDNISKLKKIKEKRTQTCIKNYGVVNPSQSVIIQERIRNNNLEKYGVTHPIKLKECIEKQKKTNIERYGVDNPSKLEAVRKQVHYKRMKTYYKRLLYSDRLRNKCMPNFDENDYVGENELYSWICTKCNKEFKDKLTLSSFDRIPRCPFCYPPNIGTSKAEKEIYNFCNQYYNNIIKGDRKILNGKEIDTLILEINLGIEFDGLYYHSDAVGKDKHYHIDKTNLAKTKGIQLIHIFEDEWMNKQDIVESILLEKMNKSPIILNGDECVVKEVEYDIAQDFMFDNNLEGEIDGLYSDDELISIMIFQEIIHDIEYELCDYCNKKNTTVKNGFLKMLNYFINSHDPQYIIACPDIRYENDIMYIKNNFKNMGSTIPSCFYVNNTERLLKIYDDSKKHNKIWDCGKLVLEWKPDTIQDKL